MALFVVEAEAKMVARMRAFLRDEIGCRALLSNYNCGTHYQTLTGTLDEACTCLDVGTFQCLHQIWQAQSIGCQA